MTLQFFLNAFYYIPLRTVTVCFQSNKTFQFNTNVHLHFSQYLPSEADGGEADAGDHATHGAVAVGALPEEAHQEDRGHRHCEAGHHGRVELHDAGVLLLLSLIHI